MGLREQSIVGRFPELCFFLVFRSAGVCAVAKQFIKNFVFTTWACAADFNNNKTPGTNVDGTMLSNRRHTCRK